MAPASEHTPRVVHFVFGLQNQDEPFHLVHYLAIASCLEVLGPEEVFVHVDQLPYGVYWDLIRPRITLRRVDRSAAVDAVDYVDPSIGRLRYAHHADIVRLDVLLEHGGLYADIDTIWLAEPPAACWEAAAAIGREANIVDGSPGTERRSLSNAVLFGRPGSEYLQAWRDRIEDALDGSWVNHSCFLAADLASEIPHTVHVEPQETFHAVEPTPSGLAALFSEQGTLTTAGRSALHLCAHLWWHERRRDFLPQIDRTTITESWIRESDAPYARLARPFLPVHDLF